MVIKRVLLMVLIVLFSFVNFAHAQSAKDVYKAVKKAELKATGDRVSFDNSLSDARAEFDLFQDSKEAKNNPDFTSHIFNALKALSLAQLSKITLQPALWSKYMDTATHELELAKKFLK